jgi:hypothetical protein
MSPFDAFLVIARETHYLLHPGRYRCIFNFDESAPGAPAILLRVNEPLMDPAFWAEWKPTIGHVAVLECVGHAERFGALIAHDLLKQLDVHAELLSGKKRYAANMQGPRKNKPRSTNGKR